MDFGLPALRQGVLAVGVKPPTLLIVLGVAGAVAPQVALIAALALCGAVSLAGHPKAADA